MGKFPMAYSFFCHNFNTFAYRLGNGEEMFLRGFGSFIIKHRAEKTARNISKNTTVIIPSHDIPAFRPAKEFMDMMKK